MSPRLIFRSALAVAALLCALAAIILFLSGVNTSGGFPLASGILLFLALLGFLGWYGSSDRNTQAPQGTPEPIVDLRQPYNIFRPIDPGTRRKLALAVFLMFSTIGPLSVLMNTSFLPDDPLRIALVTVASGGISASIILFGRRPVLLALCVGACIAVNTSSHRMAAYLSGRGFHSQESSTGKDTYLSSGQLDDVRTQRVGVGLAGIALISSGYIVFIVVLQHEGRKRSRLEAEVAIAREIQESLLPREIVHRSGGTIFGKTIPATEVGGDYFDIIPLPDGSTAVVIADVTGHGVGAGILSAMTKSAVRSQTQNDPSPPALLRILNLTIGQVAQKGIFVTMAYILIDSSGRTAHIATAGHPPAILMTNEGRCTSIRTPSMALGMSSAAQFTATTVTLAPGNFILLYTDGVSEAVSPDGSLYGQQRLEDQLASLRAAGVEEVSTRLLEDVVAFGGSRTVKDDATIVVVRMNDES